MNEDEKPTDEEILYYLSNPEVLRFYGYQLTPKGAMAMFFMTQKGMTSEEAEELAQKLEDAVFLAGYIYVHENDIEVTPPNG